MNTQRITTSLASALALLLIASGAAMAADAGVQTRAAENERSIEGPLLGYAATDPGRLEAIFGIPGAAHFGGVVAMDFEAVRVSVSPSQNYAIGVDTDDRVRLVLLSGRSGAAAAFDFATRADVTLFSASGSAVALYDRAARTVSIFRGLPAEPARVASIDLRDLAGVLTALAVSDDGRALAASVMSGGASSVHVSRGDGFVRLASAGAVSALAFVSGREDLLVADRAREEVLLVRANGEVQSLAGAADGMREPRAVAAMAGSGRALAATGDGRLALLDLSGAKAQMLDCPCDATTVERLGSGDVFRLTSARSGPVYLLDGTGDDARVLFVPARSHTTDSGGTRSSSPEVRGSR